jgi:hypothetical protein
LRIKLGVQLGIQLGIQRGIQQGTQLEISKINARKYSEDCSWEYN